VLIVRGEPQVVTFSVRNGGLAIPPAALPLVFEPLARARPDVHTGGQSLGLGLFIARLIVSAHGGEIHVQSSEAEGTTFTVTLPRNASESELSRPHTL
jgi:signal transduction histidine kinase